MSFIDGEFVVDLSNVIEIAYSTVFDQAVREGFTGSFEDFLVTLKGEQGLPGPNGEQGLPGPTGEQGLPGLDAPYTSSTTTTSATTILDADVNEFFSVNLTSSAALSVTNLKPYQALSVEVTHNGFAFSITGARRIGFIPISQKAMYAVFRHGSEIMYQFLGETI